jgi:hypothetical protein
VQCAVPAALSQEGFSAIGPKMTAQRVAAYTGAVEAARQLKSERAATIGTLTAAVRELWDEMETAPQAATEAPDSDAAFEARIASGDADGLGFGTAVIARLQGKVAALEAERVRGRVVVVGGGGGVGLSAHVSTRSDRAMATDPPRGDHLCPGQAHHGAVAAPRHP